MRGFGIDDLRDVQPPIAGAFINARLKNGPEPELATRHLRRATLRLLFQAAELVSAADRTTMDVPVSPNIKTPTNDQASLERRVVDPQGMPISDQS